MQVLLNTKFWPLWGYNYDAGIPDTYSNENSPVVAKTDDGFEYRLVFFN